MNILLVEDDAENSTMLKNFLRTEPPGPGADDYITKPFPVTEVLARIKANIRRTTQYAAAASAGQTVLTKGALTMDLNDYSVKKDGIRIDLTAKKFEILKLLLQNPRKAYTKEQIYSFVWNNSYLGDETPSMSTSAG